MTKPDCSYGCCLVDLDVALQIARWMLPRDPGLRVDLDVALQIEQHRLSQIHHPRYFSQELLKSHQVMYGGTM